MQNVMSPRQAAMEYFNGTVSYWKLLSLAKSGIIPHFKIGGRVFFRKESLDAWIATLEASPSSHPIETGVIRLVGRK